MRSPRIFFGVLSVDMSSTCFNQTWVFSTAAELLALIYVTFYFASYSWPLCVSLLDSSPLQRFLLLFWSPYFLPSSLAVERYLRLLPASPLCSLSPTLAQILMPWHKFPTGRPWRGAGRQALAGLVRQCTHLDLYHSQSHDLSALQMEKVTWRGSGQGPLSPHEDHLYW